MSNEKHRTANGKRPDKLTNAADRAAVVAFLRSISAQTAPF